MEAKKKPEKNIFIGFKEVDVTHHLNSFNILKN